MATIKLPSLVEQPIKTRNGYLYSDLHLDFTPVYGKSPYGAYTQNCIALGFPHRRGGDLQRGGGGAYEARVGGLGRQNHSPARVGGR